MFTTYIIYSEAINKYYTGITGESIEERLRKHNSNHKGYTGKINDWVLVYQIQLPTKVEAQELEKRIKKRGAGRYLADIGA